MISYLVKEPISILWEAIFHVSFSLQHIIFLKGFICKLVVVEVAHMFTLPWFLYLPFSAPISRVLWTECCSVAMPL